MIQRVNGWLTSATCLQWWMAVRCSSTRHTQAMWSCPMQDDVPSDSPANVDSVSHSDLFCPVNESASKWRDCHMDITTRALVCVMVTRPSTRRLMTQRCILVARSLLPRSMVTGWRLSASMLSSEAVCSCSICVSVVKSIMDATMRNMAYCLRVFAPICRCGLLSTCLVAPHHWNLLASFSYCFIYSVSQ